MPFAYLFSCSVPFSVSLFESFIYSISCSHICINHIFLRYTAMTTPLKRLNWLHYVVARSYICIEFIIWPRSVFSSFFFNHFLMVFNHLRRLAAKFLIHVIFFCNFRFCGDFRRRRVNNQLTSVLQRNMVLFGFSFLSGKEDDSDEKSSHQQQITHTYRVFANCAIHSIRRRM